MFDPNRFAAARAARGVPMSAIARRAGQSERHVHAQTAGERPMTSVVFEAAREELGPEAMAYITGATDTLPSTPRAPRALQAGSVRGIDRAKIWAEYNANQAAKMKADAEAKAEAEAKIAAEPKVNARVRPRQKYMRFGEGAEIQVTRHEYEICRHILISDDDAALEKIEAERRAAESQVEAKAEAEKKERLAAAQAEVRARSEAARLRDAARKQAVFERTVEKAKQALAGTVGDKE